MTRQHSLSSLSLVATLLIALLSLTGCDGGSRGDVLKYASDTDALVMTVSISDIMRNAGAEASGDKVTLTPALAHLVGEKEGGTRVGVNLDGCGFMVNLDDNGYTMFTAEITDADIFRKALEQIDMERTGDTDGLETYAGRGNAYVVIDGELAVFFTASRGQNAADVLSAARAAAEEHPLAQWKREALEKEQTLTALVSIEAVKRAVPQLNMASMSYDPEKLATATVTLEGELADAELTLTGRVLDADGGVMSSALPDKKADKAILEYAPADAMAAFYTMVPENDNWKETLTDVFRYTLGYSPTGEDDELIGTMSEFLSKTDGSVMLAGGINNLIKAGDVSGWDVTAAVQMKAGAAAEYVGKARANFDRAGVAVQEVPGGVRAYWAELGSPLTLKADGDVLLLSTLADPKRIKEHRYLKLNAIDAPLGGFELSLPKECPVMAILGSKWGVEMTATATPEETKWTARLTDTDKPLIQTLIETFYRN